MTIGMVLGRLLGTSGRWKPKNLHAWVFAKKGAVEAQPFMQATIVIEPPKGIPGEYDVAGSLALQPL